jgi:hypothetical protein
MFRGEIRDIFRRGVGITIGRFLALPSQKYEALSLNLELVETSFFH